MNQVCFLINNISGLYLIYILGTLVAEITVIVCFMNKWEDCFFLFYEIYISSNKMPMNFRKTIHLKDQTIATV